MIKIALCDDNEIDINQVTEKIKANLGNECRVMVFNNADAFEMFVETRAKGNVEIVFLNIGMNNTAENIRIAKKFKKLYQHIKIVLVSENINHVRNIFEAEPDYFLVKPYIKDEVDKAINFIIHKYDEDNKHVINISTGRFFINIKSSKINYIESFDREIWLHLNDSDIKVKEKMDELEEKLPVNFLRCHQSYIVNMDSIEGEGKDYFTLYDKSIVYISQSKRTYVKRVVREWIKNNI